MHRSDAPPACPLPARTRTLGLLLSAAIAWAAPAALAAQSGLPVPLAEVATTNFDENCEFGGGFLGGIVFDFDEQAVSQAQDCAATGEGEASVFTRTSASAVAGGRLGARSTAQGHLTPGTQYVAVSAGGYLDALRWRAADASGLSALVFTLFIEGSIESENNAADPLTDDDLQGVIDGETDPFELADTHYGALLAFLAGTDAQLSFANRLGYGYRTHAGDGRRELLEVAVPVSASTGQFFFSLALLTYANLIVAPPGDAESAELVHAWVDADYAETAGLLSVHGTDAQGNRVPVELRFASQVVPEPATLVLLGTGLAGLGAARRRRRSR